MDPTEHQGQQGDGSSGRPLIFVVEDDESIARLITHNLLAAGFAVQSFSTGTSVLAEALRHSPNLFLLDVILPGTDGFELCRQIRETHPLSTTPVVFLTAKNTEADKIKGLELGADDYITKPFSPRELIARIRNILRLSLRGTPDKSVLRVGDLAIDTSSMTIKAGGQNIPTTVREFRLLEYLVVHRGRVLTRDQLLNGVWKETPFVTPRSVDVYVRRLREKIETDARHPRYLKTLKGIGYFFVSP